jgi:hypothetical protein
MEGTDVADDSTLTDTAQILERAVHDGITAISAVVNPDGPTAATAETLKLAYTAALLVLARIIATADDPGDWLIRNVVEILPKTVAARRADLLREKN